MELKGTVDVPVVGAVDKRVLLVVGVGAVGFVGWRYYQSRSAAAYDPDAEPVDPGMEDAGILPAVEGAVRPGNDYGLDDGADDQGTGSYGFRGTTDAQWTQYATAQLTSSEQWSYTAIVTALGKYLNGKPLTTTEQQIVQAAIAVAGHPPQSPTKPVVPGGDTPITVAPTGLKGTGQATAVTLTWSPVAGATSYRIYRQGVTENVGVSADTSAQVGGLNPNTSYRFKVAAVTEGGKVGPGSDWVTVKTAGAKLTAPTSVKATATGKTTVRLTWKPVTGADGYRAYRQGVSANVGASRDASIDIGGLRANTSYRFKVAATAGNTTGPSSGWVSVKTKK
jgi:hypothetical protein